MGKKGNMKNKNDLVLVVNKCTGFSYVNCERQWITAESKHRNVRITEDIFLDGIFLINTKKKRIRLKVEFSEKLNMCSKCAEASRAFSPHEIGE